MPRSGVGGLWWCRVQSGRRAGQKVHRVGDVPNLFSSRPNTDVGVTRKVPPSNNSTVKTASFHSAAYLTRYASTYLTTSARSETSAAGPSRTTCSSGFSVATAQAGLAAKFLALIEVASQLNHRQLSNQTPHTGETCGRPSGRTVATQ